MTDWWGKGAAIGEMATGLAAAWSSAVWTRGRWREHRAQARGKRLQASRSLLFQTQTWHVRLLEDPAPQAAEHLGARVVLQVSDSSGGGPRVDLAVGMRARVRNEGFLSSALTTEQLELIYEVGMKSAPGRWARWLRRARQTPGGR